MKSKILLIPIFLLCIGLSAQYSTPNTGVSWTLDNIVTASPTTVTVSGNVYTLHEDLTIEENDELMLNTDLRLEIEADVEINVRGGFASDSDQVVITAVDPDQPYKGFWFYDESEGYFNNTTIEYGGGLRVVTEYFVIENSILSNNNNDSGSSSSSVLGFSKGGLVSNCTFTNNRRPAIGSGANVSAPVQIFNSYFEANNLKNDNRPQINLGPSGEADSIRIIGNTIIGDRSLDMVGGISVSSLVGVPNQFVIEDNIIRDNRYGITSMGNSTGIIKNNIIEDNDTETNPMNGGSGISLYNTDYMVVTGNEIRRNLWGMTLIQNTNTNLGSDDSEDFNPGGNIFSENGNGGVIYAIYNNTPDDVKALHNCWIEGQESTYEDVEGVIFHVNDDSSLGEVFFDPFDCGETVGLNENNLAKSVLYPNPAKDSFYLETLKNGSIKIFDTNGRLVQTETVAAGKNLIQINLPKGLYIVEFVGKELRHSTKLIVR